MRFFLGAVSVVCSLFLCFGQAQGGDQVLRVSATNGQINITSTGARLSEVIGRLSLELGMEIRVHGASGNEPVTCVIENASLWDALQKLVSEWDRMSFSRSARSAEVWLKGATERLAAPPAASETSVALPEKDDLAAVAGAAGAPEEADSASPEPSEGLGAPDPSLAEPAAEGAPAGAASDPPPETAAPEESVVTLEHPPVENDGSSAGQEEIVIDTPVYDGEFDALSGEGRDPASPRPKRSRGGWRVW